MRSPEKWDIERDKKVVFFVDVDVGYKYLPFSTVVPRPLFSFLGAYCLRVASSRENNVSQQ